MFPSPSLILKVVGSPAAVLVGFWHKRTQMKVEMEVLMRQNPFFAKWFRVIIDILSEKSSPEEVENLRKLLKSIEEGKGEKVGRSALRVGSAYIRVTDCILHIYR